jgi:hypothetical protein
MCGHQQINPKQTKQAVCHKSFLVPSWDHLQTTFPRSKERADFPPLPISEEQVDLLGEWPAEDTKRFHASIHHPGFVVACESSGQENPQAKTNQHRQCC